MIQYDFSPGTLIYCTCRVVDINLYRMMNSRSSTADCGIGKSWSSIYPSQYEDIHVHFILWWMSYWKYIYMTCILFPLLYCSIVKCNKNTSSAELLIHMQGKFKYSNWTYLCRTTGSSLVEGTTNECCRGPWAVGRGPSWMSIPFSWKRRERDAC